MNYVVYVEYHATNYYPSSYDYIKLSAHNLAEAVIESDKMFVREKMRLIRIMEKRGKPQKHDDNTTLQRYTSILEKHNMVWFAPMVDNSVLCVRTRHAELFMSELNTAI